MADVLGEGLREVVASCRVLVVGTGGIGCELLKNLMLTGFRELTLVRMMIWPVLCMHVGTMLCSDSG